MRKKTKLRFQIPTIDSIIFVALIQKIIKIFYDQFLFRNGIIYVIGDKMFTKKKLK